MKTGNQLVTAITENFGDRDWIGSRSFSEAALDAVNAAVLRIATEYDPRALLKQYRTTLTVGTASYSLPDRTKSVLGAWTVSGSRPRPLTLVPSSRWQRYFVGQTSRTGRPTYFEVYGSGINLYPVPDSAYVLHIRITQYPASITGQENQPFGDPWDDVIIAAATASLYTSLQEPGDAGWWENRYKELAKAADHADRIKRGLDQQYPLSPGMYEGFPPSKYWVDPFYGKLGRRH